MSKNVIKIYFKHTRCLRPYEKNSFAKKFKNIARYRFKNNFLWIIEIINVEHKSKDYKITNKRHRLLICIKTIIKKLHKNISILLWTIFKTSKKIKSSETRNIYKN